MSKVTVIRGEGSHGADKTSWGGKNHSGSSCDGVPIGKSERTVSVIAGIGLTSMAMRSHGFLRAAAMLGVAAGMFQRGFTGRCYLGSIVSNIDKMVNGVTSGNQGKRREKRDVVREASEESFPASDAPSFTPVTGSAQGAKS